MRTAKADFLSMSSTSTISIPQRRSSESVLCLRKAGSRRSEKRLRSVRSFVRTATEFVPTNDSSDLRPCQPLVKRLAFQAGKLGSIPSRVT